MAAPRRLAEAIGVRVLEGRSTRTVCHIELLVKGGALDKMGARRLCGLCAYSVGGGSGACVGTVLGRGGGGWDRMRIRIWIWIRIRIWLGCGYEI